MSGMVPLEEEGYLMENVARLDYGEASQTRQTLKDTLRESGIRTIPLHIVAGHKKDMVRGSRVGIYRFIGPLLQLLTRLALFDLRDRRNHYDLFTIVLIVYGFVAGISFGGVPTTMGWYLLFASASTYVLFKFYGILVFYGFWFVNSDLLYDFTSGASVWFREPVTPENGRLTGIPAKLRPIVGRTLTIPDIEVSLEQFGTDPLIAVTRKYGPFGLLRETEYIGAWNTGNNVLDNFI